MAEGEEDRENLKNTPHLGLNPTTPEIMIWAEIQRQPPNQLSHPGTPSLEL